MTATKRRTQRFTAQRGRNGRPLAIGYAIILALALAAGLSLHLL